MLMGPQFEAHDLVLTLDLCYAFVLTYSVVEPPIAAAAAVLHAANGAVPPPAVGRGTSSIDCLVPFETQNFPIRRQAHPS